MPRRSPAAARPKVPTIACVNEATTPLGVDLGKLVRALQKYVDDHLAPVWGTPAKLVKAEKPLPGAWLLIFLETADKKHSEDFGYHKPFYKGQPIAKVFVASTIKNEPISLVASHELAEMLVNPACNRWALGRDNMLYAYEVCDAVEEEKFKIDGLVMSDFVYPAYYDKYRKRNSARFDHLKCISRPFQLLAGGYAMVRKGQKPKPISGSKRKEQRFRQEDRRQHRTDSMR